VEYGEVEQRKTPASFPAALCRRVLSIPKMFLSAAAAAAVAVMNHPRQEHCNTAALHLQDSTYSKY